MRFLSLYLNENFNSTNFLGEIVALKRLKMEKEKEGFPITSLREICCILKSQHENVCTVRVSLVIIHNSSL